MDGLEPGGAFAELDDDRSMTVRPPRAVLHPVMRHWWECLSFVHWPMEPADVARRLPEGLEVDAFHGAAWVGLVLFRLTVALPRVPPAPWLSTFLETNVRTYVRGPDSRRGIWFLSLDAARLAAVVVARRTYRLPYVWSSLRLDRSGSEVRYRGTRRGPALPPAAYDLTVTIGGRVEGPDLSTLARFLTSRWTMYAPARRAHGFEVTDVDHPPWPLWHGQASNVDESLFAAAGLARPSEAPTVHFSPGVNVLLARPRTIAAAAPSR
jgi:uncharacterized protein YqjF (DUF2071 family)